MPAGLAAGRARKLGMATLHFPDMLGLIEDRSAALRSAAASAPLAARVPGCPGWTVADLVAHLGEVQLFWAAAVTAGPADSPPSDEAVGDTDPVGALMAWSQSATSQLLSALSEAGPERRCWTWWDAAIAPRTAGAVARHQVQEASVHAHDAQQACQQAMPLPAAAAADGVAEYLSVELPSNGPWPHDPGVIAVDAGQGGSWQIDLGPDGATHRPRAGAGSPAAGARRTATITADPGDLVLAFYRRSPDAILQVDGDAGLVRQLLAWPNLD